MKNGQWERASQALSEAQNAPGPDGVLPTVHLVPGADHSCGRVHSDFGQYNQRDLTPIQAAFVRLPCFRVSLNDRGGRYGLTPEEHIWLHQKVGTPPMPSKDDLMETIRVHRKALEADVRCPNCLTTIEYRETYLKVPPPMSPLEKIMSLLGCKTIGETKMFLADLGISAEDAVLILKKLPSIEGLRLWLASEQSRSSTLAIPTQDTLF